MKEPLFSACDCSGAGARNEICHPADGQCECESNFAGRQCDECNHGFYYYPSCYSKFVFQFNGRRASCENISACDCDAQGTEEEICDKENGKCICKEGFGGSRCDRWKLLFLMRQAVTGNRLDLSQMRARMVRLAELQTLRVFRGWIRFRDLRCIQWTMPML